VPRDPVKACTTIKTKGSKQIQNSVGFIYHLIDLSDNVKFISYLILYIFKIVLFLAIESQRKQRIK
jgi:hypothetical protein